MTIGQVDLILHQVRSFFYRYWKDELIQKNASFLPLSNSESLAYNNSFSHFNLLVLMRFWCIENKKVIKTLDYTGFQGPFDRLHVWRRMSNCSICGLLVLNYTLCMCIGDFMVRRCYRYLDTIFIYEILTCLRSHSLLTDLFTTFVECRFWGWETGKI